MRTFQQQGRRVVEQPDQGPPVVHDFDTEDGARHAALWLADKAALADRAAQESQKP